MRDLEADAKALHSLCPEAEWTQIGHGGELDWFSDDITQPSLSELDAEITKQKAEYDAQEYARKREAEYPAIADQLDEIYHNGINAWKAVIKVTKDKYPKG